MDTKPKRSLFKRPTWAANTSVPVAAAASASPDPTSKPDPPTDIFSRSHNYTEFVEDRERQRRKKKEKDERRRSHTDEAEVKGDEPSRSGKRRRISNENGNELSGKSKSREIDNEGPKEGSVSLDSYAPAPSPQKPRSRAETVIELLDDSDREEDSNGISQSHNAVTRGADPDADLYDLYDSDPEMREFVRQAREKRRREEREQSESGAHDPTVKLFITSPIPGTAPLIVSRKLSQNLQAVREAWNSKQPFGPEIAKRIFFTYKLRRVYDVTTCRSLGVKVDSMGRVVGNGPFASADEHAEKIHLEAVTDEAWQQLKAEKAAPKPNKYLDASTDNKDADGAEGTPAMDGGATAEEPLIKVTLKAKGHSDIKIKVRPVSYCALAMHASTVKTDIHTEHDICQNDQCGKKKLQAR